MFKDIFRATSYWFVSVPRPGATVAKIKASPRKLSLSFWVVTAFAIFYTFTVMIYYFVIDHKPAFDPWLPIPLDEYYLGQIFWTLPWALATWILISGSAHLLAILGRADVTGLQFEDALNPCGLAWVTPAFYTMWLPETIIFPIFGQIWPDWFDVLRIMIAPVIWQVVMTAIGLRVTHRVSWLRGILIGVVVTLLSFVMLIVFIR